MSHIEDRRTEASPRKSKANSNAARRFSLHEIIGQSGLVEGETVAPPNPGPSRHTIAIEKRYLAFIEKTFATQLSISPNALPTPKKYDGAPNIEVFDAWFHTFIRWLSCQHCDGPDLDRMRLVPLSCFLDGHALAWFDYVVDGVTSPREWTFNEAIIALYDRFITRRAVCDANDLFDSTQYNPEYGVRGFYDLLYSRGARMPYPPQRYTVIGKFIKGLPSQVLQGVRRNTKVADLYSLTLNRLLEEAIVAEGIEVDIQRNK